jgi:hypothetical protein
MSVADVSGRSTDASSAPIIQHIDVSVNEYSEYDEYKFAEIDHMIDTTYKYSETNNSLICDILATYLKGQKILYTESKTHCEQRLNFLMLPAILITAVCTILSLVLKEYPFGPTVVSSLNGANAFILALINYLKLDARAEAHRVSAYKFDKAQSYVEFNSGRILFETKASEELGEIIKKVQHDVEEIKETNQFIIPEAIRYRFPGLYNTNVFAVVKHIQNREMAATNELKDIYNDYRVVDLRIKRAKAARREPTADDVKSLTDLEEKRRRQVHRIIRILYEYSKIDSTFETELEAHRNSRSRCIDCCGWLKM